MKVLLLGEFSGLNRALKEGVEKLEVDVTLASNGDGWKSIGGADLQLYPIEKRSGLIRKIKNYILFPILDNRFKDYDIVQIISPYIYHWAVGMIPFNKILRNNGRVFVSVAGTDCYNYWYWKNGGFQYKDYIFENNKNLIDSFEKNSIASIVRNKTCKMVFESVDGIIPAAPYEYEVPYEKFNNVRKAIMFPINVDNIEYKPNVVKNKIVIFHGINRYEDKGSKYIIKAMEIVQEKYKNDVECIIVERLPYQEYEKILDRTNIVIDQCRTFGYGINACVSMAKGKVVMSGAEREIVDSVGGFCPIHNIRPNVSQIVNVLEKLILNRKSIERMGYESRLYVEEHHNYIDIAKKYCEEWKQ